MSIQKIINKKLFYPEFTLSTLLSWKRIDFLSKFHPRINSRLKKPIFVVGCPRSGTTLLGEILMSHPKLKGIDESLFLMLLWRIFSDLHQGANEKGWAPLRGFISNNEMLDSIGKFSDDIFYGVSCNGTRTVVDHTPWYVALIPFLNILYPDSIFIHIIRNPIDVVNSLTASFLNGYKWAGEDIETRTIIWKELVSAGKKAGKSLPNNRYMEIKFENLCQDPEKCIKTVLDFLSLKWEDSCLIPLTKEHAGPARKNVLIGSLGKNKKFYPNKTSENQREFLNNDNISLILDIITKRSVVEP
jgi:hypothetical protein